MGGSGGGYFPTPRNVEGLVRRAEEEAERDRTDAEANELLFDLLARFNDRDVASTSERLEKLKEALREEIELERVLFGGSVAKHTYVDGLSDVDALVVIKAEAHQDESPETLKETFAELLRTRLPQGEIESIEAGRMAVTITYSDGAEVQLLPARENPNGKFLVPGASGTEWKDIRPEAFRRRLTKANKDMGSVLVPTIKLAKSVISNLPEDRRLSGYHVEALAIDAFSGYEGRKTPAAMLRHFFAEASERVRQPITDDTGQSWNVDDYLGTSGSAKRGAVGTTLAGVARQLESANDIARWRELIEG